MTPHPLRRSRRTLAVVTVLLAAALAACGSDDPSSSTTPERGQVRRVGTDYDTIQDAVDAAEPGDLVLIGPGTYREAVEVTTPRLVIRGTQRNGVVLDGGGELLNGFEVTADQVAIENLTVRDYAINGVLFIAPGDGYGGAPQDGPAGWRASYVTAANNGLYGLYAFGTGPGQFDHNYASGHPDSGIYVGQCEDCGALVVDNVAEHNAIGYENTNASGVTVARNTWRSNRVGMTTSSGDQELLAPQSGGSIVGNLVADNADPATPETQGAFGVGIVIAGGTDNVVRDNVVTGHPGAGILITDQEGYAPSGNEVRTNRLDGNAVDLALASTSGTEVPADGACFEGNEAASSVPADLAESARCDAVPTVAPPDDLVLPDAPPGIDFEDRPEPPPQPDLPGADDETWSHPALDPPRIDLDEVVAPRP